MPVDPAGFRQALETERARNSRQIAAFRFGALVAVVLLQTLFLLLLPDWHGVPMGPLLGYTAVAAVAWRLRRRFDAWARWSGYTIAMLDLPMTYWLVRTGAVANIEAGTPELAIGVLMMLPLAYGGFIVLASLALDNAQTFLVTMAAIVLQAIALHSYDHDFTFVSLVTALTLLVSFVCSYWRQQTVRMVRETALGQLQRERLGRYFSPQVAELVESGAVRAGGERRDVTLLFADLRDFTRLAEGLDSRRVVGLLNRFHSAMVAVVFAHGGTLDKYLGDGLMAYFGAPVAQPDQAARAVRCALDMQRALADLNRHGALGEGVELEMGIGVHGGSAVVGDIGADSRREFTVIGDAVNVASRLEQLTKTFGLPILVSGFTRDAAPGMEFRLVDRVELRGRREAVEIYEPVAGGRGESASPTGRVVGEQG